MAGGILMMKPFDKMTSRPWSHL